MECLRDLFGREGLVNKSPPQVFWREIPLRN